VTMLILASFFLLLCLCGLLMKDLEWTKRSARKKERLDRNEELFAEISFSNLKTREKRYTTSSAVCIPTFLQQNTKEHRHSLTYRGAILSLKRYQEMASSCPDIISTSETKIGLNLRSFFFDWIEDLGNTRFLLFILSNFMLYMWYDIPYYFLVESCVDLGYDEYQGSLLGSTIGLCNVFGNIFLGYLGDRKWANSIRVYGCCISICGVVTAMMPLLFTGYLDKDVNYYLLCVLCGVFGVMIAANYSLTSVILVQIVSLERFANAYGLLLLMQGVGNLIGPPIAGALYDYTQTWSWTFYVAGIGILLSNVFVLAPEFFEKKTQEKRQTI